MADIESNIDININSADALAELRRLQAEISKFHTQMAKSGAAASAKSAELQQKLIGSINAGGKFSARLAEVQSTTESFTNSLEKNKFSMGEYFRYAGASTKTFGRLFKNEFDTINKVARERVKTLQTQYIKLGRDANGAMKSISVRPLALDLDNLATKTALAAQKQQLFNQLIKQGSTNLLNWGKNTQWAGRQLMVGFTIPLGIAGSMAAREFMKLEEQSIRFKRVYGDTFTPPSEADAMVQQIRNLGVEYTKYGVAVEKTMGIAADAAAMGKTGADLLAQVSEATRLAVLGGVEQQQALETTISLTNAFGTATDQLANKTNFLNAVENQTVTSIEDLTEAIPKAGPVVQQLGGDVEDLAFFLTAMREGGINASEGANALKSGLASLINPTKVASDMLMDMGINLKQINDQNRGNVSGLVVDFAEALDTLDPTDRAKAIEQMFGKFQFARLSTLFQNVIKEGSQAKRVLELTNASTAELAVLSQRELARIEESPMYKFKGAVESFKESIAPVGELFIKQITPLIEFGTEVLRKFNEMDDGVKNFIVRIVGIAGVIAPAFLMVIGLFGNFVANAIKGAMAVRGLFQKAGQSSQILGQQTEYMSQQQLEAATVAAALGQTHSGLTQIFTSEASAVKSLAEAYGLATTKLAQFSGVPTRPVAPTGPRKKYKSGVVSVPGSGSGDKVPAMLEPGEAVIPKASAKKYRGLLEAIVSDSIPGFQTGTVKKKYSKPSSAGTGDIAADLRGMYGTKSANLELERANAAAAATEKKLIELREKGIDVTDRQIASAKQLDRAHNIQIDKNNKDAEAVGWTTPGAWSAQTNAEQNSVYDTLKKSKVTQDTYLEYLKKTGATEKEIASIRDKINKGVALSERELSVSGKALRAMGKDWEDGKLIARQAPKAGQVSEKFGMYATAVGAGQQARDRVAKRQEKADKAAYDASVVTEKQVKKAQDTYDEQAGIEKKVTTQKKRKLKAETAVAAQVETAAKNPNRVAGGYKAAETRRANKELAAQQLADGGQAGGTKGGRFARGFSRAGGVAGVSGIASGLALGASFLPGKVGETAQQFAGPIMAISGVASALSMLPAPAAAVVGALAAIGTAVFMATDKLNKGTEAGRNYAKSISMTNEKLTEISEITGTVSATDARREANKQPFKTAITNERLQEGKSFLESGAGKKILGDISTQMEQGLNNSKIGENVGKNLSIAIAQGVMTQDQAENIAAALGQELGNNAIPLAITGKISKLLGPNGENLTEDPLQVMLDIQTESASKQVDAFGTAMDKIQPILNATNGSLLAIGTTVTGIGAGMAATGVGVIPGAITAAAGGLMAAAGSWQAVEIQAKNNELLGAAAQLGIEQVAQNNGLIDSLNKQYDIKVAEAKTQEEINRLEEERRTGVDKLNEKNRAYLKTLLEQAKAMGPQVYSDAARAQIDSMYKEGPLKTFATKAKEELDKISAGSTYRIMVETMMATGEMDPLTAATLTSAAANNEDLQVKLSALVDATSMIDAGSLTSALIAAAVNGDELTATIQLVLDGELSSKDVETATKAISGVEAAVGVDFNIEAADIEQVGTIQEELNKINGETITPEIAIKMAGMGIEGMAGVVQYWDLLKNADGTINKEMVLTYTALVQGDKNLVDYWMTANPDKPIPEFSGIKGNGKTTKQDIAMQQQEWVASQLIPKVTEAQKQTQEAQDDQNDTTEKTGSSLDDLVKKIRNVKNAAIGLTTGWKDSMEALKNYAKSGFQGFNGLEQQMRRLGAGEDAIQLITGMSKEEWDANKDELFNFDANGNITSAKEGFSAIANGIAEMKLGEFHTDQQKVAQGFVYQQTAISKLTSAGMSYADALEVVKDTELARSIATNASASELADLVRVTNEANAATREYNALVSVSKKNTQTAEMRDTVKFLGQNAQNFTDAQKEAILADPELAYLVMNPDVDPAAVQEALDNAANEATLEIDKKKLTFKGLNEVFQDGFNKAMEAFAAQEKQIELKFKVLKDPLQDAIDGAKDSISDLQNGPGGMDDLSAELERISYKEDDINEKYDERIKALDDIASANDRIARQQKAQLTIADALTRGDISAAAVAAQEMRSQQAADAIAQERDLLEAARKTELENTMATMGLNREQIEDRIRALKMQILEIEEGIIEPYEYQIELLDRQQQVEIDSLAVLGLTKDQWIAIENQTRLAVTSSEEYKTAMENALGVVKDILTYWEGMERTFTTTHVINEIRQVNGVNTGTPGGGPSSDTPTNTPTNTPNTPANNSAAAAAKSAKLAAAAEKLSYAGKNMDNYGNFSWNGDMPNVKKADEDAIRGNWSAANSLWGWNDYWRNIYNSAVEEYNIAAGKATKKRWDEGGKAQFYGKAFGGLVPSVPGLAGKFAKGSDTVPTMLTPGEFVIKKAAVENFGAGNLKDINNGTYGSGSVYNYDISVNVKSDADANEIARTVMTQIKQVESQRIRGNRF